MLRKILRRWELWGDLLNLLIILAVAIAAGIAVGWAAFTGVLIVAFILFDGLGSIWALFTKDMQESIDDRLDEMDREDFDKGSKDNPTIR